MSKNSMALWKRAAFLSFTRLLVGGEKFGSRPLFTGGGAATPTNDLVSDVLAVGAPSLSVVPLLERWVKDGKKITYNYFQRIIRSLRDRNRYSHALEVSEWMSKYMGLGVLSSSDHAVRLDLIGHVRGVEAAESFFESTDESDKNIKVYGALLSCYTRLGELEKSSSLAKKMEGLGFMKSPLAINNMMTLYSRLHQNHKIPQLLSEMKKEGIPPNYFTYTMCLSSYGKLSDFDSMEKLLLEIESLPRFKADWQTYATAVEIYIAAGSKERALHYLKKSEERVRNYAPGYIQLISLYAKLGSKEEVLRLWKLQETVCGKHTNLDYKAMLSSLLLMNEVDEAEGLLKQWSPVHRDIKVPNVVISWHCRNGNVWRAERVLKEVIRKGWSEGLKPSSWTILASGYEAEKMMTDAVRCFKEALALRGANPRWTPKPVEMVAKISKWVGENGEIDEVVDLVRGVKGLVEVEGEMRAALEKAAERRGVDVGVIFARIEEQDDASGEEKQSTA